MGETYTASLCNMVDGVPVPYEIMAIMASSDTAAIEAATDWLTAVGDIIRSDSILVVRQGARGVHSEPIEIR